MNFARCWNKSYHLTANLLPLYLVKLHHLSFIHALDGPLLGTIVTVLF